MEPEDKAVETAVSPERLQRARDFAVGRYAHLGSSPERLRRLAEQMPLTRPERQRMRLIAKKAGAPSPIALPSRVRLSPTRAHPEAVRHYLQHHPAPEGQTPQQLAAEIGAGAGFTAPGTAAAARRAVRAVARQSRVGGRLCGHLRDKAVLASAISAAVRMRFFPEGDAA